MPTNISTLTINASPERVWDVLTKAELIKLWQYGSELYTDWMPGSEIRFRSAWEDKVFEQWGKVIEVNPFSLVKYSLFALRPDLEDKPENYFIMSYRLTPAEGQTRLEIIQQDDRPGARQEDPQGEESAILKSLKDLAESDKGH